MDKAGVYLTMSDTNGTAREAGASGSMLARTLGLLERSHLEILIGKYTTIPNVQKLHRNTLVTLLVAQDSPDLKIQVMRLIGREMDISDFGPSDLPVVKPHTGRPAGSRNRPK